MLFQANSSAQTKLMTSLSEPTVFGTAQAAWLASLSHLVNYGEEVPGVQDPYSVGSAFGDRRRSTKELSSLSFSIASPRHRLILSKHRPIDLGYAIANTIWVLTASDNAEAISFYNPHGRHFSDDGICLFSAPGTRIFSSSEGDQFEKAIERLKADQTTRRAVIQIFSPADLFTNTRDCSCVVSLQFLLRGKVLSCITYMRSQSALMVMPYDIFLLSMIHEAVAVRLGVEPGIYHHFCGSLHYYDDEEELVHSVLDEYVHNVPQMPSMTGASTTIRKRITLAEQDIRKRLIKDIRDPIDTNQYDLDSYWAELLRIMIVGARQRHGVRPSEKDLVEISEIYRPFLLAR
jgi:thymidylate synthase